jgi:transcriptional regulator with XRE-family HTH domain
MSQRKYDLIWSCQTAGYLEQKIGEKVAEILRREHAGEGCHIRNISSKTGISSNTIRKWYGGRKPPYLAHFMILAKYYPAILQMFLEGAGHEYLIPHIRPEKQEPESTAEHCAKPRTLQNEAEKNFRLHADLDPRIAGELNNRQLWFWGLIKQEQQARTAAICAQWPSITDRTARSDVAKLVKMNLIRFVGEKKHRQYEMIQSRPQAL